MSSEPERHVSPDGRTILLRTRDFHPADGHEISPLFFPRVIDAASGATVLDLTGGATSFAFAWEDDGALLLTATGTVPQPGDWSIRLSLAGGWYEASVDGWTRRPLPEAQARLEPLTRHQPDPHLARDAALHTAGLWLQGLGWLALIAVVLWLLFQF